MFKRSLIFLSFAVLYAGCDGNKKQEGSSSTPSGSQTQISKIEEVPGEKIYNQYCFVCHQAKGEGIEGMYPPISESEFVNGDKDTLISIILHGLSGPIEVKGEKYNNVMPPQDFLTDQQIADVLTYVRGNFGNSSTGVTPDEVNKARGKK